jgi:hypothetical protein
MISPGSQNVVNTINEDRHCGRGTLVCCEIMLMDVSTATKPVPIHETCQHTRAQYYGCVNAAKKLSPTR